MRLNDFRCWNGGFLNNRRCTVFFKHLPRLHSTIFSTKQKNWHRKKQNNLPHVHASTHEWSRWKCSTWFCRVIVECWSNIRLLHHQEPCNLAVLCPIALPIVRFILKKIDMPMPMVKTRWLDVKLRYLYVLPNCPVFGIAFDIDFLQVLVHLIAVCFNMFLAAVRAQMFRRSTPWMKRVLNSWSGVILINACAL